MSEKMLFADAHLHVNPIKGLGAEKVAVKMRESGMWFGAIVSLPHWSYGIELRSLDDYKKILSLHVRECEAARRTGLKVSCFSGLHPAEIDRLIDRGLSHREALELSMSIVELLFRACDDGAIDGIGEIGRQHYEVRVDKAYLAQLLLYEVLEMSREHACLIQLHLENIRGFTAWSISDIVERAAAPKDRIILHHLRPGVLEEAHRYGFFATTPAYPESLEVALMRSNLDLLLVESDYVDESDARRKGIEPWSMRETMMSLLRMGKTSPEALYKINIDNIEKVFKQTP